MVGCCLFVVVLIYFVLVVEGVGVWCWVVGVVGFGWFIALDIRGGVVITIC